MEIKTVPNPVESHSIMVGKSQIKAYNAAMAENFEDFGYVRHASASRYGTNYRDLMPNISGRPGMTRQDYEFFRPNEAVPKTHKEITKFAQQVYENNGLIREIIDLMGDFAVKGIRVSSTDKREERFYRNWFTKIKGPDRSERFLNTLYRLANVVIRRQTATINRSQRATLMSQGKSDLKVEDLQIKRNEIPWRYIFLDPATVDILGDNLATFANKKIYVIRFPDSLKMKIGEVINTGDIDEKKLIQGLPAEILNAIKNGKYYKLPEDKTLVFHYKKDDWKPWALPMVHAIADDILMLEKLKLADISALDGAISNIRIIKLGSLDPLVIPGKGAVAKLKNAMASHVGGGTVDIVWDSAIDLLESKSEVYKFLGPEKYTPTMNAIYGGLGVPPTLTGSMSGGTGTTNNLVALQTLVERLEYGRSVLIEFWNNEFKIVKEAMAFTTMPKLEFDYMELGDAASTKNLLIQLSDRGLISDELLQEKFQHDAELEDARIKGDFEKQKGGKVPPKASPFHNAEKQHDLDKIKLQNQGKVDKKTSPKGVSGQGRPKNSNDKTKRKTKRFVPKSKASLDLWINDAQDKITEVLNPAFLVQFEKKNMRSLTAKQAKLAEGIKFGVLMNMEPFDELTEDVIKTALNKPISSDSEEEYAEMCAATAADLGRELTYDDTRHIQRHIYENYC